LDRIFSLWQACIVFFEFLIFSAKSNIFIHSYFVVLSCGQTKQQVLIEPK
jgi:hypothetical protein